MKAFAKPKSRRVRFESFELDLDTSELQKNGRRVRLQDQPGRLLALLAGRPGELVTRTEIQKTLWEEGRFVEFDHAVNTAIKKVREALEDDPEAPRIIETLPRKGYRFIAVVEEIFSDRQIAAPTLPEPLQPALPAPPDFSATPDKVDDSASDKTEPVIVAAIQAPQEMAAPLQPARVRLSLVVLAV